MKKNMTKTVTSLVAVALMVGIIKVPVAVKAEEAPSYPVDISDGQVHEIDIDQINNDIYDYHVLFKLSQPVEKTEFWTWYKGGVYEIRVAQSDADEVDSTEIERCILMYRAPESPSDYVSGARAQQVVEDGSSKLVIMTEYNWHLENPIVLGEGESVTLTADDVRQAPLLHLGDPTGNEKKEEIKIKPDGTLDEDEHRLWEPKDYWVKGTTISDPQLWFSSPVLSDEPFSSVRYPEWAPEYDLWRGEDRPATSVTISYTKESGFKIVYDWRKPEPEPEPEPEVVPDDSPLSENFVPAMVEEPIVYSDTTADPSTLDCQFYHNSGKSYWYENGVRQGTVDDPKGVIGDGTVRGREIYDAATNAWYWCDSINDGAKAINKEVWMPYVYQGEKSWSEAEIKSNAEASGEMSAQVEKAIKAGKGKWVRYNANGKMYKGWYKITASEAQYYPEQVGNIYYYDVKTGLMAYGDTVIDGVTYHFDEVTGVLVK